MKLLDSQALCMILGSKGLSMKEAAKLAGVSPCTVQRLCAGKGAYTFNSTLYKLAKALDVPAGDLIQK